MKKPYAPPNRYEFAKISIDAEGQYWLTWYGVHPDQRRCGSVGFSTLESLSNGIALMSSHGQHDLRMAKVREKETRG